MNNFRNLIKQLLVAWNCNSNRKNKTENPFYMHESVYRSSIYTSRPSKKYKNILKLC